MWLEGNCEAKRNILNKRSHVSVSLWYFPKKILRKFLNCLITNISVLQQKAIFFAHYGTYLPTAVLTFDAFLKRKIFCVNLEHSIAISHLSLAECQGLSALYVYFVFFLCVCFVLSSLPPSFTSCLLSTSLNLSYLQVSHQCLIPPSCASLSFVKASSITPRVLFFVFDEYCLELTSLSFH